MTPTQQHIDAANENRLRACANELFTDNTNRCNAMLILRRHFPPTDAERRIEMALKELRQWRDEHIPPYDGDDDAKISRFDRIIGIATGKDTTDAE